jgi:hypothetical protein
MTIKFEIELEQDELRVLLASLYRYELQLLRDKTNIKDCNIPHITVKHLLPRVQKLIKIFDEGIR